ncbi:odorant receptor 46a-like isoform X2 [Halictus rubicundus]|uniref:odorant receptor 46a-like isoform X2 n=1 Tax=Halictus rubicundus TaxID=77578 RepID=UPI004035954D
MRVLKMVTRTLIVCGCWHPESWTSPSKTLLYQLYRMIVILLVYSVTFYQIMDLLLVVETLDEFADNLYMLTAMMIGCQKLANMLLSHKKILDLIDTFQKEPFAPQNNEEVKIRAKFEKTTHTNTVMYASLLTITCAVYPAMVFFKSEKWPLLFRAWLPYNYSTTPLYLPTVAQQSLALYYGALNHAACDSLFCGLMIHVCSQFEILGHRLNKIARGEIATIKSCIHFHDKIYRYAEKLNTQFKMIIFMQFLASAVIVSFNLYRVTQFTNLGPKLFEIIMYSQCIMIQIFIYCWYGNELKLKSLEISDVVHNMNWIQFDNIERRMILMMMRRASEPIELTSIHIATLNLDSYVTILKTSYSAYSVLQ